MVADAIPVFHKPEFSLNVWILHNFFEDADSLGGMAFNIKILFMEKDLVAAYVRNYSAGKIKPLQKRSVSRFASRIVYALGFMEMPQLNANVKAWLKRTVQNP